MIEIHYQTNPPHLDAETFLHLVQRVWPGQYRPERTAAALKCTTNITAWHESKLIACVRLLTDGYFFSTITEILVDPQYQKQGIGAQLIHLAWQQAPSSLAFGVQPGKEAFFEKQGFTKGLPNYEKRKKRD